VWLTGFSGVTHEDDTCSLSFTTVQIHSRRSVTPLKWVSGVQTPDSIGWSVASIFGSNPDWLYREYLANRMTTCSLTAFILCLPTCLIMNILPFSGYKICLIQINATLLNFLVITRMVPFKKVLKCTILIYSISTLSSFNIHSLGTKVYLLKGYHHPSDSSCTWV